MGQFGVADIVIPLSFGLGCLAFVLTIIFSVVFVVYYIKIRKFKCDEYLADIEKEENEKKEKEDKQNE